MLQAEKYMNKAVFNWLLTCIALVFCIVLVGGYTRLSHSGLSIVEWKPLNGIIPPLTQADWQQEFSLYQRTPEYLKVNYGMSIAEFKEIFFVEYIHRILGRLIGVAILLPLVYFAFKKILKAADIKYFTIIVFLVALQGFVGWFMVRSGLISNPNVSQYRLALHLSIACIIIILLVWKMVPNKISTFYFSKYGLFSLVLLLGQIISGAFVAGLKAGLVYNSFPLMDGELVPPGLFILKPWYKNFFENVTTVQFTHRVLGFINFINLLNYSNYIFRHKGLKHTAFIIAALVFLQLIIGVLTLILQVPMALALIHQAMAIIILITMTISLKLIKEQK